MDHNNFNTVFQCFMSWGMGIFFSHRRLMEPAPLVSLYLKMRELGTGYNL